MMDWTSFVMLRFDSKIKKINSRKKYSDLLLDFFPCFENILFF